jgi:transposase
VPDRHGGLRRAHHLSRQLLVLGHDVKLVPGQFVKPFLKGQKNDFRDTKAVAEAVQRPTMRLVPTKSVDQLDLQALHRVRSRLISRRTAIVNQIQAFLLERGIAVRQGLRFLRQIAPGPSRQSRRYADAENGEHDQGSRL